MDFRNFTKITGSIILTVNSSITTGLPYQRPNIVWIMLEDIGYQFSCYGEKGVQTPNIDKFASEGIRFTNSFCTAPVSSPSRSAMMTGFYQNYIGAEQHRTENKKPLPYGIKPITYLLEEAGYFTCFMGTRKTDLNFITEREVYQGNDWNERLHGQPFYAQISISTTHRTWKRDAQHPIDFNNVDLPPYYPQVEFAKRDWANGLEACQIADRQVKEILDRLSAEGLSENTLVFIIGDNGLCMPRGKQFLYEEGIQVPIFVRWPAGIKSGQVRDDLVMTIDISKTILDVAGAQSRHPLQGFNLLDGSTLKRKYIFAARDKMDNTHDAIRAIRSNDFKLIRNLMPERPWCQFNSYKERSYPVLALLNVMYLKGELNPDQAKFMAPAKPEIELYNIKNDKWELNNLADNPKFSKVKKELMGELDNWCKNVIHDKGVTEEFSKGGWPSAYPTRSLAEWEKVLELWKPWVYRDPDSNIEHPGTIIESTGLIQKK
jgi:N-sulfoglucosamine sulfohydrolase